MNTGATNQQIEDALVRLKNEYGFPVDNQDRVSMRRYARWLVPEHMCIIERKHIARFRAMARGEHPENEVWEEEEAVDAVDAILGDGPGGDDFSSRLAD